MAANPNFGEAAYRAAARPIPKKPVAKKPVPVRPTQKATVGQSAAQQIVNSALAPLLASIKSQENTLRGDQSRQQEALRGFTNEILAYLKGTPADIASDYQGAVNTTRDLAQASADQLLKSNPNSLDQESLAAINAPQSQRDALAAQNQNVFGGGSAVLFKTGGALPAGQFASDQAAASAFADSLPDIQALQAKQLFQRLLATQGADTAKLAAQRAEVEAKRPGLLLDAQASIAKSDLDRQKFGLQVGAANLAQDKYRLSVAKMNQDLAYKTANMSLSERRVAVAEANSANSAFFRQQAAGRGAANFYTDKQGRTVPKGYTYNPKGQLLRVSSGGGSSGRVPSGLTKSSSVKTAAKIASVAVGKTGPIVTNPTTGEKGQDAKTYQEAMAEMLSAGVALVDAQRALNAYWTKPGMVKPWELGEDGKPVPGAGRPLKSFQQRNPKKGGRTNVSFSTDIVQEVLARAGIDPTRVDPARDPVEAARNGCFLHSHMAGRRPESPGVFGAGGSGSWPGDRDR